MDVRCQPQSTWIAVLRLKVTLEQRFGATGNKGGGNILEFPKIIKITHKKTRGPRKPSHKPSSSHQLFYEERCLLFPKTCEDVVCVSWTSVSSGHLCHVPSVVYLPQRRNTR